MRAEIFDILNKINKSKGIIPVVAKGGDAYMTGYICMRFQAVFSDYFRLPRELRKFKRDISFVDSCYSTDTDFLYEALYEDEVWSQWLFFIEKINIYLTKKKYKKRIIKELLENLSLDEITQFTQYYMRTLIIRKGDINEANTKSS